MAYDMDALGRAFEAHHAEVKAFQETVGPEVKGINLRVTDLEQKLARPGGAPGGAPSEVRSVGARVVESQDFKTYLEGGAKGRVRIEVKTINPLAGDGSGSSTGGSVVAPDRQTDIDMLPWRPFRVRDLLRPGRTTSNLVQIPQQTGRTNNAAPVAETSLKPQSDMQFALVDFPVKTIAHFMMASKQVLADAPVLQATIDTELRYGLADQEDEQLLNGNGTGLNLNGLSNQAAQFAVPAGFTVAKVTDIDVIRAAMIQTRLALYPATGVILNPIDWASIETTKDVNGRYIFSGPNTDGNPPAMWGRPVAETEAMAAGSFMVGAFGIAAQIFDREEAAIYLSTEDRDNFVRNLVTILAEERLALAVRRPAALVQGTFAAGLTALTPA